MTPQKLVPGIERYPELAVALKARLSSASCTGCAARKLAKEFQDKLRDRFERDKWLNKP